MSVNFGDFVVDLDQRRLFEGGREVRLTTKAFELLRILLENRPKALSKDELFAQLWPDTFVTENNLATLVGDLRRVLSDNPHHPRFIRTVYGYGYAFPCEATESGQSPPVADSAQSGWKLLYEHREIPLHSGGNILGRCGSGVVLLNSPTVSRHHAKISIAGDGATVEDLGSKNGTWLRQVRVTTAVPVQDGDRLRFGSVLVILRSTSDAPSTETIRSSGV